MSAELDVDRFYERLARIHAHFVKHRSTSIWNKASCLSLSRGAIAEDQPYLKSVILHQYLFGYELPDTVLLLNSEGQAMVLATKKKCEFLQPAVGKHEQFTLTLLQKNKADQNQENFERMKKFVLGKQQQQQQKEEGEENDNADSADSSANNNTVIVGRFLKETNEEGMVAQWESKFCPNIEKEGAIVDVTAGIGNAMAIKDPTELDLLKKSSVLSNKVMKHAGIPKLEEIIDSSQTITHEQFAQSLDTVIEDPSQMSLKVPKEDVSSCYFPILQSGGHYDLKVSATPTSEVLKFDVILCSLGARYKQYCSHISRTFLIDPPKVVTETYEILLGLHDACLKALRPGKPCKSVHKAAVHYLQHTAERPDLIEHLPKHLGFGIGLDYRDATTLLSAKNNATLHANMVFCLTCGLQNLPLDEKERKNTHEESHVKRIDTYSLQIGDTVVVTKTGAEVMTKLNKAVSDVSYTINDDDDGDDDDEDDAPNAPRGDAAMARRLAKEMAKSSSMKETGQRTSSRLAKHQEAAQEVQEGAAIRERKQVELMTRRNEERLQEIARAGRGKRKHQESDKPEELQAYRRTKDYPKDVLPNQVKVDMANQCVILPICGCPIAFHISTIKNVVLPDPDNATYLRINFYTAGMAVGKDAPANTAKLVAKYAPYASFIREMTFRSLDSHSLTQAFRQISELRKRARMKELRDQEEANLVEQEKLVRTRNERVPRLSDLTMRPVFAGRKTQGNLEAHTNGLRFISTRSEVVDIMYNNIKYAIFQPCENEIMVLIHFRLKNAIMVGKKRHIDIQFLTEVVDSSQTVDGGHRSMYDPDEMDDEQRERQLRKKLNSAFREFCKKVDGVAKRNGYELEFDLPYRDLGFTGNPHKEMVFIQPTLNCLVNLTETPFFVVDLADVDHVHFERVTYMSKAFDMVMVNKDFTKQPWRVDMIDNVDKDPIQDWLTDMEITYTQGPMNLNWKSIMQTVAGDDRFYRNTEEDEVTEKEAGWEFLRLYGKDDDDSGDDDEDDSGYSEGGGDEEEDDEEESEEEDFDSEEDESDFDADEELEEQGLDWDDMERQAIIDDRRRGRDVDDGDRGSGNSKRRRRRGSSSAPPPKQRKRGRR